jgi:hypothetical protein
MKEVHDMRIINFETRKEAETASSELFGTGFWGSHLTIQYNGNINRYMLIVQDEDDSYRDDFLFDDQMAEA